MSKKNAIFGNSVKHTGSMNAWLESFRGVAVPEESQVILTLLPPGPAYFGARQAAHIDLKPETLAKAQTTMPPSFVVGTLSINREKKTEILKKEK